MDPRELNTALLSSFEKDKYLLDLARLLEGHGWDILASRGTADSLRSSNIKALAVDTIVGEPILGHKVVTLSREIHAGLLATTLQDFADLKDLRIQPIGLVYVTFYPLEDEIRRPGATFDSIIQKTDIGGPTMLRSAVKGGRIVLSGQVDLRKLDAYLGKKWDAAENNRFLASLQAGAELEVARYVMASAVYRQQYASRQ